MKTKVMFLIVEGDDDERFMERVVKPRLLKTFADVKIWQCSQQKQERTENLIHSARRIGDYLYFRDIDDAPCVTARKESLTKMFKGIENEKIVIVRTEIEGWYLAGLDRHCYKEFGIRKYHLDTDGVTKEHFSDLIPKRMPRPEFMARIIQRYKIDDGRRRNGSFRYFMKKHLGIS